MTSIVIPWLALDNKAICDTDAINLSSIIGAGGFVIKGEPGSFWSSHLVSSAGDVNGDGLDDLIVSARDTGKSYVVFGKQDTNAINLPAIAAGTSTDGFVIKGEPWNDYRGPMSDNSMAPVLSFLPNTTYDLPAFDLSFGLAS
jgi:hypothetical protein